MIVLVLDIFFIFKIIKHYFYFCFTFALLMRPYRRAVNIVPKGKPCFFTANDTLSGVHIFILGGVQVPPPLRIKRTDTASTNAQSNGGLRGVLTVLRTASRTQWHKSGGGGLSVRYFDRQRVPRGVC